MKNVIVSRHPATIRFIAEMIVAHINSDSEFRGQNKCADVYAIHDTMVEIVVGYVHPTTGFVTMCQDGTEKPILERIRVISGNATDGDVRGKDVWGNVPLHLACVARSVYGLQFERNPPRGVEYGVKEMREAGAHLSRYVVRGFDYSSDAEDIHLLTTEELRQGGYAI